MRLRPLKFWFNDGKSKILWLFFFSPWGRAVDYILGFDLIWLKQKQATFVHPLIITVFFCFRASLMAQTVKHLPTMQETRVQSLGQENLLDKEMATHSSILAWKMPWMEEPGRLQSMGSQRVRHNWATSLSFFLTILKFYRSLKSQVLEPLIQNTKSIISQIRSAITQTPRRILWKLWVYRELNK